MLVTESKILRRIFGPKKKKDGTWRIQANYELNNLIKNKNITDYIKAKRLSWFGHVCRMAKYSMVKNCIDGNRQLQD